jgi:hypothetical protein
MTDPLESDLRAMLQEHAAPIAVDSGRGEVQIEDRLATGGSAVTIAPPPVARRGPQLWTVRAAAVLLLGALAVAVLASQRGGPSTDNPSATTLLPAGAAGSRLTLAGVGARVDCSVYPTPEQVTVITLPNGECVRIDSTVRGDLVIGSATAEPSVPEPGAHDLWNVRIQFSDNGLSLTRGLAAACFERQARCQDGRIVLLIDDVVADVQESSGALHFTDDALVLPQDVLEIEARTLARDLTASIGNPPPDVIVQGAVDLTLGHPGEAATDVAERVMFELLGDASITTEAQDLGGATAVTMETSTGATVVAEVVFDQGAQVFRVTSVASPGLVAEVTAEGDLYAELPAAGSLHVRGFTEDFRGERDATPAGGTTVEAGRQGPLPQPPAEYAWLILRLETEDGQVLWAFSRR